ncbi:aquaporin family protein [Nitriliruptoraceae bacterium ZYF776]|nr:aquaporin family protein [Profundirhabdus halotolerans]
MVYLAEFIGTAILLLLGDGVVANVLLKRTKGEGSGWIVITTGWGLAVAIAVYAVGWISGAHINPAVTVGLAIVGEHPWLQVPGYVAAQVAGAAFGATLVWLTYRPHWRETEDPGDKLAVFATVPAIRHKPANLATELIGTFLLVFGILAIAENAGVIGDVDRGLEDLWVTGINPLIVGFLVWAIGLSLGGPTGYAINPARDLGPRLAHAVLPIPGKGGSDWAYSWIPIVGPLLGAVLAALLWGVLDFGALPATDA